MSDIVDDPAAGMTVSSGGADAERGRSFDHRFLERPYEWSQEDPAIAEAEDRIGHELARAVVGDLATTLDPDGLDAPAAELTRRGQNVGIVGLTTEGQHGIMLEEQEVVRDGPARAQVNEALLERPRIPIGDPPEPHGHERRAGYRSADRASPSVHARTIAGAARRAVPRRSTPVRSR